MPIAAILFGGRRATNVPLVNESLDWEHGVFIGATVSSETDRRGRGHRRRAAPRPVRDAAVLRLQHGRLLGPLAQGRRRPPTPDKLPRIYQVNWFRKDADGKFLWPGFGENSRVLDWIIDRVEGDGDGVETPIGIAPAPGALYLDGLDLTDEQVAELFAVDPDSWLAECDLTEEYFAKFGDAVPAELHAQLGALRARLEAAQAPDPGGPERRDPTSPVGTRAGSQTRQGARRGSARPGWSAAGASRMAGSRHGLA